MDKRKPNEQDWIKIRAMHARGVPPRKIIERFPELDLKSAKALSTKLSRSSAKNIRKAVQEKATKILIDNIAEAQAEANEKLILASNKIIDVINNYLQNEQYFDYTTFSYGKLKKDNQGTLNTEGLKNVVKALKEAQAVQRLALDMDKDHKENMPAPVINIDLGDKEND